MKLAVAYCSIESQNIIIQKAYSVLSANTSLQLETIGTEKFSCRDEWICSLFASVIIALRPQTHIPNARTVLHLLMTALHNGCVAASQALGSMVNKLNMKSNDTGIFGDFTFEEAMDIIFSSNLWSSFGNDIKSCGDEIDLSNLFLDASRSPSLQFPVIVGLAWIGKGLLMRGSEKVKDIAKILLNCLLSDGGIVGFPSKHGLLENGCSQEMHRSLVKSAADAFQILMSDSELCLNRNFHAMIRPLYKQRFYSSIMPILCSLIIKSDSSFSRYMLFLGQWLPVLMTMI